jgi:hypothetical protein
MNKTILVAIALFTVICLAQTGKKPPAASGRDAGATLKIVKDSLSSDEDFYVVKGSIYNPNSRGVKNVVIRYYVWKQFMGKNDAKRGSIVNETGGLTTAKIKYLPPKQTIEFTTGDSTAVEYSDIRPDPLSSEITAEWDE